MKLQFSIYHKTLNSLVRMAYGIDIYEKELIVIKLKNVAHGNIRNTLLFKHKNTWRGSLN